MKALIILAHGSRRDESNLEISDLTNKEIVSEPIYSFQSLDSCKHEMWVVDEENKVNLAVDSDKIIKLNPTGSILPVKYGKGGPMDFSELCIKEDGTSKVYANSC